jgi:hypothetical protein
MAKMAMPLQTEPVPIGAQLNNEVRKPYSVSQDLPA